MGPTAAEWSDARVAGAGVMCWQAERPNSGHPAVPVSRFGVVRIAIA